MNDPSPDHSTPRIMLNNNVDTDYYRKALQAYGRTRIDNILEPSAAETLYEKLRQPLPWELCLNGQNGPEAIPNQQLNRLSARQKMALQQRIQEQARRGFAFQYARLDLIPGNPPASFQVLRKTFASAQFLNLMQTLTQDFELERVDGQITMYQAGCFLKTHEDIYSGKSRRYAYVLNLTKDWRADWGGLLHFLNDKNAVEDAQKPSFNTLTLFKVPTRHFVSCVSDYATGQRYAVTGWLFAPDPG